MNLQKYNFRVQWQGFTLLLTTQGKAYKGRSN